MAAGDIDDLPALREWCASLPRKSYGHVFLEVDSAAQVDTLETPPGVGVTWLVREAGVDLGGLRLMNATNAWLDEWVRADPLSGRFVHLWTGSRTSAEVNAQWERIRAELAANREAAKAFREHHA